MSESAAGGRTPAEAAAGRVPGSRLLDLVAVMDTLRTGCPWDAKQTHESLAPHLLEETYEAIDALASEDQQAFRDELGDVLLQVVFHARVAEERTDGTGYTIDDVADGIISKLTRRHPHVFADVSVSGPDEVKQNWDAIKAAERAATTMGPVSALDGVPLSQPALSLAAQLLRRAGRAGAPPELAELREESARPGGSTVADGPAVADGSAVAEGSAVAKGSAGTDESGETDVAAVSETDGAAVSETDGAAVSETDGAAVSETDGAAVSETDGAAMSETDGPTVSELGRRLFDLVVDAQAAGLDPELELRAAARAYADRVRGWEAEN